jgi:hypothetical protein
MLREDKCQLQRAQRLATCKNLVTIQCLDADGEGLNTAISNGLMDLRAFVRCLCTLVNMASVTHYLH